MRLTNQKTGVTVEVSEEKAERLSGEWAAEVQKKPAAKKTAASK